MSDTRVPINEGELNKVVGGLFTWHKDSKVMDYTHADGSITYHKILNYDKGWEMSNQLHAKFVPEDEILKKLIDEKYIEG